METIPRISLKLNFTPNTLGCYGLMIEKAPVRLVAVHKSANISYSSSLLAYIFLKTYKLGFRYRGGRTSLCEYFR